MVGADSALGFITISNRSTIQTHSYYLDLFIIHTMKLHKALLQLVMIQNKPIHFSQ